MNETPQSATPTAPLIGEPILPPLSGEVPPQGAERFSLFLGLHGRLNSYDKSILDSYSKINYNTANILCQCPGVCLHDWI